MKKDDLARAANPRGNRFELEPDAGFARALAQVDFSRGSPVRERVRARVFGQDRHAWYRKQGGYWMKLSRASFSWMGGIILLVMAVFAIGWGIENLLPHKGANLLSNPSVFTPTVTITSTPIPAPTATLQPISGSSFQQPIKTSDAWDPLITHAILQKWMGNSAKVLPVAIAIQKRTFYEYADGHQELVEYACEPGTGQELNGNDRTRRCIRIEYSDETQELTPQAFSDCLLGCLRDLQTVQVRGATAYLGWSQSVSGGNSTELHWREDGVTVTLVAFGNWPWPDEANPHRLDEMVLRLAESLIPAAAAPTSGQGTGGRIAWPRDNQQINGLLLDDRYVYFSAGPHAILRQSLDPSRPLELEEFAPLQYPSPNTDGTLLSMPRMLKEHWLYYVDVGDGTAAPRWTLRAKNTQTLAMKVVLTGNTCLVDFSVDGDTLAWIERESDHSSPGQAVNCLGDNLIKTIQLSSGVVKTLDRSPTVRGHIWKIAVSGNRLASVQGANESSTELKTLLYDLTTGKSEPLPGGALGPAHKTCQVDITLSGPWLACRVSATKTALYNFDTRQTQSYEDLLDTEGRNSVKIEGEWLVWSGHTQGSLYNLARGIMVSIPSEGRSVYSYEVAVSGPTVAWIALEASGYVIHWLEIPPAQATPAPTLPAGTFVTPKDGTEVVVRAGPGTRYEPVGRLKGGEKAPALGRTSLGEWIKINLPGTPDGAGWLNGGLVTISGAELPIIADASAVPPGARTGANLLGMQSSPEEIRDLILHPLWSVVWVDGQSVHHNAMNGSSVRFFAQAWLERTEGGRVISSDQLENVSTRTPGLLPRWVWLHDGKTLQLYDTETKSWDGNIARRRTWSIHPLETACPLMKILFPYVLERAGDQHIQTVREETFAGQPALVIDWGLSRFWVDETSGVILRQQDFYPASDRTGQPQSDLFLSQIRYASQLPAGLFDLSQVDQLRFQETPPVPSGLSSETPAAPLPVTAAEYSHDGQRLNVVTTQGITIYTAANLEKLDFIPNSAVWPAVAFSPDGSLVAIGSGSTVRLLRLADAVEIAHLDTDRGKVARLRFTPDGRSLASLVRPPGEEVYHYILELWSIPGAQLLGAWNAGALADIAFTPDSQTVYAWNPVRMDGIYRWQIPSGTQLPVIKGPSPGMLLFSPDGRLMVTYEAYDQNRIVIQNVSDGKQIYNLVWKKQSYGGQLSITSDGSRLVGLSLDGQVQVWRFADGILLQSFAVKSTNDRSFMTLSPDNQTLLLVTTQGLSFYNLNDGQIQPGSLK